MSSSLGASMVAQNTWTILSILNFYLNIMAEYRRIAENVAPSNLFLTNFKFDLPVDWPPEIIQNVRVYRESVKDLSLPFDEICLMDSESSAPLTPKDSTKFRYFLLGGILGNGNLIIVSAFQSYLSNFIS